MSEAPSTDAEVVPLIEAKITKREVRDDHILYTVVMNNKHIGRVTATLSRLIRYQGRPAFEPLERGEMKGGKRRFSLSELEQLWKIAEGAAAKSDEEVGKTSFP